MLQVITDINTNIPLERIKELLIEAYKIAQNSPDPSTQNGALLVTDSKEGNVFASDCNRFPDGVPDRIRRNEEVVDRWEKPIKYKYVEHAERNVIYQVAKAGEDYFTENAVMVCPWAACTDCARAIIQAGITTLVTHKQAHDHGSETWLDEIALAFTMLEEAGVDIVMYDGDLKSGLEVRHGGKIWTP